MKKISIKTTKKETKSHSIHIKCNKGDENCNKEKENGADNPPQNPDL